MKAISKILIGALLVLALAGCQDISLKGLIAHKVASANPPKVLLVIANSNPPIFSNMKNALAAFSDIGTIDSWDSSVSNPTVAKLKSYDVVFMSTDSFPTNIAALCSNLAQYLDEGGRVVLGAWDWAASGSGFDISGTLLTQYSPFQLGFTDNFTYYALGTYDSSHPIMAGVTGFVSAYRNNVSLKADATLVASWDDTVPLVAELGHVIALNVGIQYDGLVTEPTYGWYGDGWELLRNAITYIWHKD